MSRLSCSEPLLFNTITDLTEVLDRAAESADEPSFSPPDRFPWRCLEGAEQWDLSTDEEVKDLPRARRVGRRRLMNYPYLVLGFGAVLGALLSATALLGWTLRAYASLGRPSTATVGALEQEVLEASLSQECAPANSLRTIGELGGRHGTCVAFVDRPESAAKQAEREDKLLLVLHISGDFEDSRFT